MLFIDDFIGLAPYETNINFCGSDTEELFNKNLKTKPIDWYYRNNPITYQRNNYGHRCKNIEEINLNNYFLVIGCSHTEGIGLYLEDTYSYLLSKEINYDYYNLALGGTGIDILQYNLLTWYNKIQQKPKFIVLQNPNNNRFSVIKEEYIENHGAWIKNKEINDFIILGDQIDYFNSKCEFAKKVIKNTIKDVPIIELTFHMAKKNSQEDETIQIYNIDRARDDLHMGNLTHRQTANKILKKVRSFI